MPRRLMAPALACLLAGATAAEAGGERRRGDWGDCEDWGDEGARHCEVREVALGGARSFAVDATPNGGIHVEGGDLAEARLVARIQASAPTDGEARELASQVRIATAGTIRAQGPAARSRRHWSVSFLLRVPRHAELDLEAGNGGIHVEGVNGTIRFRTVNGGVHLDDVAGDVSGRTVNGGLHVRLAGSGWEGAGLDARTTNGGVSLALADGYRASLETGTVNGRLEVDFPVTVSGRIGKSLALDLGGGGPPLRIRTTNGGVKVRRLP